MRSFLKERLYKKLLAKYGTTDVTKIPAHIVPYDSKIPFVLDEKKMDEKWKKIFEFNFGPDKGLKKIIGCLYPIFIQSSPQNFPSQLDKIFPKEFLFYLLKYHN